MTEGRERDMLNIFDWIPCIMREYLERFPNRKASIEMARDFIEADDFTRKDILAFFEYDTPGMIEKALEEQDGQSL